MAVNHGSKKCPDNLPHSIFRILFSNRVKVDFCRCYFLLKLPSKFNDSKYHSLNDYNPKNPIKPHRFYHLLSYKKPVNYLNSSKNLLFNKRFHVRTGYNISKEDYQILIGKNLIIKAKPIEKEKKEDYNSLFLLFSAAEVLGLFERDFKNKKIYIKSDNFRGEINYNNIKKLQELVNIQTIREGPYIEELIKNSWQLDKSFNP
ncbi:10695_t:CDS:1, partial [Funneliformis caledonium]